MSGTITQVVDGGLRVAPPVTVGEYMTRYEKLLEPAMDVAPAVAGGQLLPSVDIPMDNLNDPTGPILRLSADKTRPG